eukprot:1156610-Pelagomonas_calceolata.AAC.5
MGKLSRRWPAWPAQRTPALNLIMQAKQNLLSGDLSLGGWAVQRAMLSGPNIMFGSQGDVSWPAHAHRTGT